MDKIIEQLHHMEVDANRHLESVQDEKLALRQNYDQKKLIIRNKLKQNMTKN
ncbi:hypothetical protein HMPREF9243_0827 [Aerococcus sp. Group 1]|uniref:hypothetical protein n=1 Tax=Aerococcus urinae (strain CCUG 59500 / ACS-120-V-Col10a) TaxID=2976812 RepID=UPI000200E4DE|nr:hypothetical protein [Aerococcus sp. Group 1]AEA01274.1 hypothetical protein HMPREF9243_0827 [Aerococcus sp. Group 1]